MGAPLDRKVFEDESGAGEMARGADDLGAGPAVLSHDALAVKDILNGILRLVFLDYRARGNSLCDSERGHDVRFDELVVGSASGEDQLRGDSGLVLVNAFERAFALLWRGCSVGIGWRTEDDDRVEVSEARVVSGDVPIDENGVDYRDGDDGEHRGQKLTKRFHHKAV